MKTRLIYLFLFTLIIVSSCAQEEVVNETENFSINTETFNLDLKAFDSFGKEHDLPNNNIKGFLLKNFNELLELDESLELMVYSRKDKKTFAIQDIEKSSNSVQKRRADPPGSWDSETVCKTCRSEDCVKNNIAEAVGDVDIRVRVKSILGVQTGLEVCYERYVN